MYMEKTVRIQVMAKGGSTSKNVEISRVEISFSAANPKKEKKRFIKLHMLSDENTRTRRIVALKTLERATIAMENTRMTTSVIT